MLGYFKDPKATAEAIKDEWFYTGDIGEFVENKFRKITGRKKKFSKHPVANSLVRKFSRTISKNHVLLTR